MFLFTIRHAGHARGCSTAVLPWSIVGSCKVAFARSHPCEVGRRGVGLAARERLVRRPSFRSEQRSAPGSRARTHRPRSWLDARDLNHALCGASAYLPIGCGSRQRSVAPGCASGSAPERAIWRREAEPNSGRSERPGGLWEDDHCSLARHGLGLSRCLPRRDQRGNGPLGPGLRSRTRR